MINLSDVKDAGVKKGDFDALMAQRCGDTFNDWLPFHVQYYLCGAFLYSVGVDIHTLDFDSVVKAVDAWNDGYRSGYGDCWQESLDS